MADLPNYGNPDRDLEQAFIALKKGSQLIKYSRKGKPKVRQFRLSSDGTTLIWFSHKKEKSVKLASILKLIPGQRTAVFKRFARPEKDYLSFSLIYKNGERSLDLICKDQAEVELWFTGLKALISKGGQHRRTRTDVPSDGFSFSDDGGDSVRNAHSFGATIEVASCSFAPYFNSARSDVGSDGAKMHIRTNTVDGSRLSISSAPSCSSQGSGPDDIESLGDVYVWGEIWSDGTLSDGRASSFCQRTDVLLPKPLESNVVLDVHQIACGFRHAALVTRQGEVFTWGEEFGGRLGHGTDTDVCQPRLVETLAVSNVDYVACGEFHTCSISTSGDLFTWGDGAFNAGLLGQGTDVSHWIPKRVSGPLEGFQVLSVACGSWHSALATSDGKLFTFGDGTFGVLGHGDRKSIAYPKSVESLGGLRTIKVACGIWHTAAIVEVMGQTGVNVISRKLFTWGDGDKNRLGHGDKEARLIPTCVSSLFDYNFHQLACGHTITVGLATSGHVFTMGSTNYGQLGNLQSDGKLPCLVQGRLVGELVEEISCGAYHVAVLTSRSEVYTWGRGANGRLGHGDVEDRETPTLVEALKDRHVKNISCGSNFTACICIHKWVSGADQSVCSGCRQAFGFTRKRHNCYNCGLVHCHACSSKKVLKAALAPTPGKPHRVCDSCYTKLKASEASNASTVKKRNIISRGSIDSRERLDRGEVRASRLLLSPTTEPVRCVDVKSVKNEMKSDTPSLIRASPVPSLLQLKDISFPSSLSALQSALRPIATSTPTPAVNVIPASPCSRKPSPPRSATPLFSRSIIDSLKKTNELLDQEVLKLQAQVNNLKHKCEIQDAALQKSEKKAKGANSLAAEESAKCNAAMVFIKSLQLQLKDMEGKLPPEVEDSLQALQIEAEALLRSNRSCGSQFSASLAMDSPEHDRSNLAIEGVVDVHDPRMENHGDELELLQNSTDTNAPHILAVTREATPSQGVETSSRSSGNSTPRHSSHGEAQLIEQFEPGVYVTLVQLQDGTKVFKQQTKIC
ncbi:PH, RCC1 and FYVE domains-containing protein 1-like isoform X2 [Phoenix dactylifera]|uniref:PH, RCC1 and FYVE domains-containing protein 1-like isoform X2 n=1 Tax=Phoenix dactylifera TaxID=42345 RepID=A0A8B8ZLZ7_PHODC|nr:PH, RCC1 and FYVE domains-containing protein 1-like isoform X2 [Phoenix dactylifera]